MFGGNKDGGVGASKTGDVVIVKGAINGRMEEVREKEKEDDDEEEEDEEEDEEEGG